MRQNKGLYLTFIVSAVIIAALTACSTAKNTSKTRWWHSFNARYNTYYNGNVAYIDGYLEKENGNKDNYTEMIPLFMVGNKTSRELGKGNFDRANREERESHSPAQHQGEAGMEQVEKKDRERHRMAQPTRIQPLPLESMAPHGKGAIPG